MKRCVLAHPWGLLADFGTDIRKKVPLHHAAELVDGRTLIETLVFGCL
jgi:hypothetical protein